MNDNKKIELGIDYGDMLIPPFDGSSEILQFDTEKLLDSLDKQKLFKGYWRGGGLAPDAYENVANGEFKVAYDTLTAMIINENLLDARGFYSYFPVITDNNKLILLNPHNKTEELTTFEFPIIDKNIKKDQLDCFTDFFRPEGDILAIQIVTTGHKLLKKCEQFFKKDDRYSDGFYLNAIGTYLTDTLAEKVTKEIRRGLMLPKGQGKRFSFGYFGMCEVREQKKIFDIMDIEHRLGVTLSSGYQMIPEHTTLGLFTPFKEANFFK